MYYIYVCFYTFTPQKRIGTELRRQMNDVGNTDVLSEDSVLLISLTSVCLMRNTA